jgi:hypothetical protein
MVEVLVRYISGHNVSPCIDLELPGKLEMGSNFKRIVRHMIYVHLCIIQKVDQIV